MTNLITLSQPASSSAEAYRSLRTNLYFAALEQPFKSLVIVSPTGGESKSAAVANLAVVLAQGEQSVIAVDADFRSPSLHTQFGLGNERGLSDALGADDATLHLQSTSVKGLSVLTSGPAPAVPSDLLNSKRMSAVLLALAQRADVVVIDAPPTAEASDAAIIASKADAALVLIAAGKTRREHAQAAKELLGRAKARLLGAVVIHPK